MATLDANGNLHGRNGRFIPKDSYDISDEDIIIEINFTVEYKGAKKQLMYYLDESKRQIIF